MSTKSASAKWSTFSQNISADDALETLSSRFYPTSIYQAMP